MPSDMSALKKCIRQRNKLCKTVATLIDDARTTVDVLRTTELVGDMPHAVANMYDGIISLHNTCKKVYPSRLDAEAIDEDIKALYAETAWLRAERDSYTSWESDLTKRIIKGDMSALEELLESAYENMTGGSLEDKEAMLRAIKELDEDYDDDEGGYYA